MSALYAQSYGSRGCIVRVYEPREGAPFMIAPRINGRYHPKALGHRDATKAEAEAYALISAMKNGVQQATQPSQLTISQLVDRYLASATFRELKPQQRAEKTALLRKIVAYFGPAKRVVSLDEDTVKGLLTARREGTHGFKKAGQQSVYHCFSALRSVILWATKKRDINGQFILNGNPFAGMSVTMNESPNQPIISHATFETLRRAARKLPMHIRVFWVVVEAAGKRAGAVRQLAWDDVDFEGSRLAWRGETEKNGTQVYSAASRRVLAYLRIWRTHCPSATWVFPAPKDSTKAVQKSTVDMWPTYIYKAAGLKKPRGVGTHALRRKWASERDAYPLTILMAAGNWRSSKAALRYMQLNDAAVKEATLKPTRRV